MIGVVFATEEEARPFLRGYERGRFDSLAEGEVQHDAHLLVALTGLGKIKATLRTERLLQRHRLRRILHIGTCTALNKSYQRGQLVGAAQVFEGDRIELAAPTYPRMPLEVLFGDLTQGTLVTQDHTVTGQSEYTYWQRIADMNDMTGYAVAYVAATHGIPCHIVKVVAGHVGEESDQFKRDRSAAHEAAASFLLERLGSLVEAQR